MRNSAATLRDAIESITSQDFPPELIEMIFVDDGSTDKTLSIIESYVPEVDMQVKIFHHEWKGLGYSRNVVVNNASGDYIIWVDGDITLSRSHVRKQVNFMEKNPKVVIAGGSFELVPRQSLVALLDNLGYVAYRLLYGEKSSNLPGTGGAIFRVEAIRQIGGFDDRIRGSGEDIDIAYRVKSAGWLVVRDKALFYGRCKETWNGLWKQYVWHGYGAHYVSHKNKGIMSLPKMSPPIMFFAGVMYGCAVYKLIKRKIAFFLPLHFVFKNIAWWFGFLKSHMEGYGHQLN